MTKINRQTCFRPKSVTAKLCGTVLAVALAGSVLLLPGKAAAEFPERKVTLVVPMTAGGLTDVLARVIANHVQAKSGKPVIVENKPGGGTMIGTGIVARGTPDGYTFLSAPDAIVINPLLQKTPPFDVLKDFAPVTEMVAAPNVLFVRTDSGISTFAELVAASKKEGSNLSYASPGAGTLAHLAMEIVKAQYGMNIVHVPYSGGAPQMQAVLSGTVQVGMLGLSGPIEHMKSGQLRAVAIFDEKRWPAFPDVPTAGELGITLTKALWYNRMALFTTAGAPPDIVKQMSDLTIEALLAQDSKIKWTDTGNVLTAKGPAALGERIRGDLPALKDVIAKTKL